MSFFLIGNRATSDLSAFRYAVFMALDGFPLTRFIDMDLIFKLCNASPFWAIRTPTHNDAYVIEGPPYWKVWETEIVHLKVAMLWSLGHLGIVYAIGGVHPMRKVT